MDAVSRLLLMGVLLVCLTVTGIYRRRAQAGRDFKWNEEGQVLPYILRGVALFAFLYLLMLIAAPGWVAWSLFPVPRETRIAAGIFGMSVVPALAAWAQSHLGRNVSTTVVIHEDHELITTGPYRWVRHPLYTVGILMLASLILISGSWLLAALTVIGVTALNVRCRKEEANLRDRFGQAYADYAARTRRFLPIPKRPRAVGS